MSDHFLFGAAEARGIDADILSTILERMVDRPLETLAHMRETRKYLDALELEVVTLLRRDKKTWREIGFALGISGAAAHKKYGHLG